jgi:hypothetical protein
LNLTIRYSNTGSSSAVSCDAHTFGGTVYTVSGVYTKTFTNVAGCDSLHTLSLTINYSTHNSTNQAACESYQWSAGTGITYTTSGIYTFSYTNAAACTSTDTLKLDMRVQVSLKAFLGGAYDETTGLMSDSLRITRLNTSTTPPTTIPRLIPTLNPYGNTAPPYGNASYPTIGYAGGDTVSQAVLAVTGNNAIVDWVLIELRSALSPATVIANKRALIQRDGDVVSATDGVSPVTFSDTLRPGYFYVSIKHRNHLGIMSAGVFRLNGCTSTIDLTTGAGVWANPSIISNSPRKKSANVYVMWSGDVNRNKNVKYNGTIANDKQPILDALGISTPNNTIENVYRLEDVNMDGKIRYNNTDNDRVIILNNGGVNTPNNVLNQHTPN